MAFWDMKPYISVYKYQRFDGQAEDGAAWFSKTLALFYRTHSNRP